jgi:hypothetical protein
VSKTNPNERKNKCWLILCNAQSLLNKLDELRAFVFVTKPLFICVCETWFTSYVNPELITIKGYKIFRNDRGDNELDSRRGGGTVIYVSLLVRTYSVTFPPEMIQPPGIECNFVHLVDPANSCNACLLCAYLPPGLKMETFQSFVEYVSECFDYILVNNPEAIFYVCGDFNRYDLTF